MRRPVAWLAAGSLLAAAHGAPRLSVDDARVIEEREETYETLLRSTEPHPIFKPDGRGAMQLVRLAEMACEHAATFGHCKRFLSSHKHLKMIDHHATEHHAGSHEEAHEFLCLKVQKMLEDELPKAKNEIIPRREWCKTAFIDPDNGKTHYDDIKRAFLMGPEPHDEL